MAHRMMLALGLLLLTFGLAACGVSADWSGLASLAGLALLSLPFVSSARAGPPMPCDGYESASCQNGYIQKQCCPKGARCNFAIPSYVTCNGTRCVVGDDPGRCPSPEPTIDETKKTEAECGWGWQPACVKRKVTKACIMPVPTNYSGPSRNPMYRTCGEDRCTTHNLIEDCFPTKAELGTKACDGAWTKVCLSGQVQERCLKAVPEEPFTATTFAVCPDKSCVVGPSATTCPK